jgi:hypothetical protein
MKTRMAFYTLLVLAASSPVFGGYGAGAWAFHGVSMETVTLRVQAPGGPAVARLVLGYDDLGFDESGPETLIATGWAGQTATGYRVEIEPYSWQLPSHEPGQRPADAHAWASLSVEVELSGPVIASWWHHPGQSLTDGTLTSL